MSAVLLVLLILAFLRIQADEKAGNSGNAGPEQTQETYAETSESGVTPASGPAPVTETQSGSGTAPGTDTSPMFPAENPAYGSAGLFTLDMVPSYSGKAYSDINGDVPFFTEEEMTAEAFHEYWPLDELGRCTGAYACVGPETLPKQKRGDISMVRPTGWNTNRYDDIDGEMLFNICKEC